MKGLTTTIYRNSRDLPELEENDFFHSRQLFEILLKTPRQKPYLVVTTDETRRVVSHLLGTIRILTQRLNKSLKIINPKQSFRVFLQSPCHKKQRVLRTRRRPLSL